MKRRFLESCILAAFLLSLVNLTAVGLQDFWQIKPFSQWTAKEVEKLLLSDSPWTRIHKNEAYYTGQQIVTKGGVRYEGGDWVQAAQIVINWFARPIREAAARQMELRNPDVPKAQLDAILNRDPRFIEILVTDLPQARGNWAKGGNAEISKFKENTYLLTKSTGKISLSNMVMPKGWGDALILQFVREVNGKTIVNEKDQEVTLFIKIDTEVDRFTFNLKEMVIKGTLEI